MAKDEEDEMEERGGFIMVSQDEFDIEDDRKELGID